MAFGGYERAFPAKQGNCLLYTSDPDNGYIKTVWGIGFKMQED